MPRTLPEPLPAGRSRPLRAVPSRSKRVRRGVFVWILRGRVAPADSSVQVWAHPDIVGAAGTAVGPCAAQGANFRCHRPDAAALAQAVATWVQPGGTAG